MPEERSQLAASRYPRAADARRTEPAYNGDTPGVETAFREADEAGSTAASPILAQLLAEQADGHGAIASFQRAVRRGHVAPGFSLGGLLAESPDARGLINAYRVAARCGDQGAAYQLGLLYLDRGDLESARSAFAKADKLGHAWAALGLGEILRQTGDRSGAIAAYRRAADRRVTSAHACLEALLAVSGDTEESTGTGRAGFARPANRWSRQRLAWTAGTVAAFAALLIVALLTLLPTAGRTPVQRVRVAHAQAGTKTPATRAAAGGVGSFGPKGGGRTSFRSPTTGLTHTTAFTVRQSALLDSVPGAAHAQCLPQAGEPLPRSNASIRCFSSAAGVTALYYGYASLPLLRRVFHNYRAWFASRQKLHDCAGLTHGTYYQGSLDSTIAGRWACFYNDRTIPGSACIDWVDYGLLVFGSACQADGNFTALARWWRHAGPVPASTRGLTNRYS
jgi:Tetratricopeptide repeat